MGVNQSIQGVDKNLAINNLHIITGQINKKGSGSFSFTGQPNAMGGREVGGLSTTLAVHLDYSDENCQKVSKFWDTKKLPTKEGLTAYQDSESSHFSHIQIPALPFGQKEGTQTNMDRTLTQIEPFESKNGLLQDWEIFAKLGQKLGYEYPFSFTSFQSVFEEYQAMCRLSEKEHLDIFKANYKQLMHKSFVWGEGLYKGNRFFTKSKPIFVENLNLSEQTDSEYPFTLITGRIRDQWHSGSKTVQLKSLLKHKKLEFVEINIDDAKELRVKNGKRVKIYSRRGEIEAEVVIADVPRGVVFVPISHKKLNYLTDDKLDPLSKEPDYNHGAVGIKIV